MKHYCKPKTNHVGRMRRRADSQTPKAKAGIKKPEVKWVAILSPRIFCPLHLLHLLRWKRNRTDILPEATRRHKYRQ